jgi:putative ABC transport system substrate-binding protein
VKALEQTGIVGICAALIALVFGAPISVEVQAAERSYRVGFLTSYSIPPNATEEHQAGAGYRVFEQTLRDRGYEPGQTVSILYRTSQGRSELLPSLASQLVDRNVDVIVTLGTPATRAAQQATKTIPIVIVTAADPVQSGLISSLSRPGGNTTGSSEMSEELVPKRIQLLKEAIPKTAVVAVLWDPSHPTTALELRRTEAAARTLGLKARGVAAGDRAQIERAFVEMRSWEPDALVVIDSYSAFLHMPRIVELAKRYQLPTIYGTWQGAKSGALLSYGVDILDQYRHAALFVDSILKGAKPGDLPVRQATKFRLAVNLNTAKALRLEIPQSLLVRADDVFE